MIGYIVLGTNDTERSYKFYDTVLGALGAGRAFNNERLQFWASAQGQPMIAVGTPYDEQTATHGNGTMVAIPAGSREKVDELYKLALDAGATCDGEPGERVPNVFYGAYVRDFDGNKLCFFQMTV